MGKLTIEQLSFLNRGPYSFAVENGKILGLHGNSGAGKTVLLRAIADLDPHEGSLLLDQSDSSSFSGPEWRRRVGYLAAESFWWHETVAEHFSEKLPEDHLQTLGFTGEVMNWEISRLSTGEKQRLALLRLLANQPEVLLLDEPTASLDQKNVAAAEALIKEFLQNKGAACIWVSHDEEQLRRVADMRGEIHPGGELRLTA